MSEPSRKVREALSLVQSPWDATRTERTLTALPRARRSRRMRTALMSGLSGALVFGMGVWFIASIQAGRERPFRTNLPIASQRIGPPMNSSDPAPTSDGDARLLRLADGSSVSLLDARTDVAVDSVGASLVALHLHRGRARFEVSARPERVFRIRTAELTVEVLGTVFEVEQRDGRTWVQVTRGRVAILWGDERTELTSGEEGQFPPDAEPTPTPHPDGRHLRHRRPARSVRHEDDAPDRAVSWRDHAEAGDFSRAFRMLPAASAVTSMDVSKLLLAADAARLSGHPQAALPYLERVVKDHPEDERAPLASFTLGNVLMHQLGRPREAEAAYEKARTTTKSAELAQDALARQVEAAHRAGDSNLARHLARAYLEQYPNGRRADAVRRFGRL